MAAVLAVVLVAPTASAQPSTGSGSANGGLGGCTRVVESCLGLGTPFGGDVHTTRPDPGCIFSGQVGGYSEQNGQVVTDSLTICPDLDGDGLPDPPPPPSHAEVLATCPALPNPALGLSPADRGWTGLTTWIWDTASSPRQTSSTIRTYPVACTAAPTRWTADSGDADHRLFGHDRITSATTPGTSDDSTPLRYPYERTGTYQLSLVVDWQRTTYLGGSVLGTDRVRRDVSRSYEVWEIRSRPAPTS